MNLADYVRILVRRGWIVLLAMILTAGSAYVFSRLQTPIYRATQKILIQPARNDFGLTQTLKQVMSSYRARLDSDLRAQEVLEALEATSNRQDMTPGDLRSRTTISGDIDTLQITIDVDSAIPAQAVLLARTYGELFARWRETQNAPLRQEDRINAELQDYPTPGLFRPATAVNVLAGALLGAILGGAIVFVLELLSANIVRRSADVERYLGLPVLGTLPNLE